MAAWDSTVLSEALASAMPKYAEKMLDQSFDITPTLQHLKEKGSVKFDGGAEFVQVPLRVGAGVGGWFGGYDQLDHNPVRTVDAAKYYWRNVYGAITISWEEEQNNSGKERIVNLLEAKIQQAKDDMGERLGSAVFNGVAASKQIIGLETAAAQGSYGEIDGTLNEDWRAYNHTSSAVISYAHLETAINTVSLGRSSSRPTLIVTTQTLFEKLKSLVTSTLQLNPVGGAKAVTDIGVDKIQYSGVEITFDPNCASGEVYGVNAKTLSMYIKSGAYMTLSSERVPQDQMSMTRYIVTRLALGSSRRRDLFKLTNKTAA